MAQYSDSDVAALVDAVESEIERRIAISEDNRISVQQKKRGWFRSLISNVCNWLFGGIVSWLVDKVLGIFTS